MQSSIVSSRVSTDSYTVVPKQLSSAPFVQIQRAFFCLSSDFLKLHSLVCFSLRHLLREAFTPASTFAHSNSSVWCASAVQYSLYRLLYCGTKATFHFTLLANSKSFFLYSHFLKLHSLVSFSLRHLLCKAFTPASTFAHSNSSYRGLLYTRKAADVEN